MLFQFHEELTYEQIRILFSGKLVWEMLVLKDEDPWQDINACEWSGCEHQPNFAKAFDSVSYGIKIFNIPINFIPWDWRIASKYHTPIEEQGFGPYQVIFGLFKEASEDPDVRSHFKEYFDESDFENDKAMMRAILDKPTYSYALTLDYILTKLVNSVYKNTEVRATSIFPPFIKDKKEARQFSIVSSARFLTGNPEWSDSVIETLLCCARIFWLL